MEEVASFVELPFGDDEADEVSEADEGAPALRVPAMLQTRAANTSNSRHPLDDRTLPSTSPRRVLNAPVADATVTDGYGRPAKRRRTDASPSFAGHSLRNGHASPSATALATAGVVVPAALEKSGLDSTIERHVQAAIHELNAAYERASNPGLAEAVARSIGEDKGYAREHQRHGQLSTKSEQLVRDIARDLVRRWMGDQKKVQAVLSAPLGASPSCSSTASSPSNSSDDAAEDEGGDEIEAEDANEADDTDEEDEEDEADEEDEQQNGVVEVQQHAKSKSDPRLSHPRPKASPYTFSHHVNAQHDPAITQATKSSHGASTLPREGRHYEEKDDGTCEDVDVLPDAPPYLQEPASVLPSIEDSFVNEYATGYDDLDEDEELEGSDYFHNLPALQPERSETSLAASKSSGKVSVHRYAAGAQWHSGEACGKGSGLPEEGQGSAWFGLASRPYLSLERREEIFRINGSALRPGPDSDALFTAISHGRVFHADFCMAEIEYLRDLARHLCNYTSDAKKERHPLPDLRHIISKAWRKKKRDLPAEITHLHRMRYSTALFFEKPVPRTLLSRSETDLQTFLDDIHANQSKSELHSRSRAVVPRVLLLARNRPEQDQPARRRNLVPSLLLGREIAGNRAFGSTRRYVDFTAAFKSDREDDFETRIEWTGCAGDISTISWVSNTEFVCGTTTHSDPHNQQYNRPGNLLLGSSARGTLRAYPDHRIARPVVSRGDNALAAMVESQDPWLFSSVVSSDYDVNRNLAFTSSFDYTVKVWKIDNGAGNMEAVATWAHEGRVNFVLASKHASGMVATAAHALTGAVRVYHIEHGLQEASFDTYSCMRVDEEEGYVPSDKWGYCPAAIRWGLQPEVHHLLLIGYSPRNLRENEHENEIPEDRVHTGELCVWDTIAKTQVKVVGGSTQNVFEVAWHPFRDVFAAATSKAETLTDLTMDDFTNTNIRIFARNEDGHYGSIKKLDCSAVDINELTIRPNSASFSYVAASCTDGNVYVWDTSGTDTPMCVLKHGEPIEELLGDREHEDVGAKFAAWATTSDRLYTGSSDGVVKVWNIRHGKGQLVRNLLEVPGPITCGAFSPDNTKLAVGDGTGRVFLVALEEEQETVAAPRPGVVMVGAGNRQKAVRRPRAFIPHVEIPASGSKTGPELAQGYIEREEIVLRHRVGAVQGPQYAYTVLFRADAHRDEDASQPLLGVYEKHQQENAIRRAPRRFARVREVGQPDADADDVHAQNLARENCSLDLDVQDLDVSTRAELDEAGAELVPDYDLKYEEQPLEEALGA